MSRLFIRLEAPVFDDRGNVTAADVYILHHDGAYTPCWTKLELGTALSDHAHELVLENTDRAGLHIVRRLKNGKAYANNYKLRAAGIHVLRLGDEDELGYALSSPEQDMETAEWIAVDRALKRLTLRFMKVADTLTWLFRAPVQGSAAHKAEDYERANHRRFVKANAGQFDPAATKAAIAELQALLTEA